jgi:hypothetical protein
VRIFSPYMSEGLNAIIALYDTALGTASMKRTYPKLGVAIGSWGLCERVGREIIRLRSRASARNAIIRIPPSLPLCRRG